MSEFVQFVRLEASMRGFLEYFVALFGVVCTTIGLAHVALGPVVIPGSIAVNATMDSEDRFYATLFVGFGATLVWCSRNLEKRGGPFGWLLLIFFAGGIARLVSVWQAGLPHPLFQLLTALELVLPIALWLAYRKTFRRV